MDRSFWVTETLTPEELIWLTLVVGGCQAATSPHLLRDKLKLSLSLNRWGECVSLDLQ